MVGSMFNGAGAIVFLFWFSGSIITASSFAVVSLEVVGSSPSCSLAWLECSSRKGFVVRGHPFVGWVVFVSSLDDIRFDFYWRWYNGVVVLVFYRTSSLALMSLIFESSNSNRRPKCSNSASSTLEIYSLGIRFEEAERPGRGTSSELRKERPRV